jgi:hypothetical protein
MLSTKVVHTVLSIHVNKAHDLERPCFIEVWNLLSFTSTRPLDIQRRPPFFIRVFLRSVWHAEAFSSIAGIEVRGSQRLNMELDLLSLQFLGSCIQLYSLAETPQFPPPLAFGLIYGGAIGTP